MERLRTSKYGKFSYGPLRFLLRSPLAAVLSHWTFQSLFYMGLAERVFKLGLDIIVTGLVSSLLNAWLTWHVALILGFLAAHTLNFLFNGHLWGVLKNYGYVHTAYNNYNRYMEKLAGRANRVAAIERLVVVGSLAKHEWTPQSDLDARILYKPGALNSLRVCLFLVGERTHALLSRFPLDIYAMDHEKSFRKTLGEKQGIDLLKQ
ncbi:MAG TPA: hypothetical protein VJL34_11080 [Anaerolineales bacterium]|nr:hypothetical protein [Anaerolineales bacterium]